MVTKDDAMEYILELEDMASFLRDNDNAEVVAAITERLTAIKKYVWNSDYKICPPLKA